MGHNGMSRNWLSSKYFCYEILPIGVLNVVHISSEFLVFQVVLGYSLDASPELVNQAYIVNAHVLGTIHKFN